jgi:hypothetical protein
LNARTIISISIPPDAPDLVAELAADYHRLREQADGLAADLRAAEKGLVDAQAKDITEAAEAFAAGKPPAKTPKHEAAAVEAIERLGRHATAATVAANTAAMTLSHAIADHADEWEAKAQADEAAAAKQFTEALLVVTDAARKLAVARGTIAYLERHDPFKPSTFNAPSLKLPARIGDANSLPDVDAVVDALAKVAAEPEVPAGRRFTTTRYGRTVSVKA